MSKVPQFFGYLFYVLNRKDTIRELCVSCNLRLNRRLIGIDYGFVPHQDVVALVRGEQLRQQFLKSLKVAVDLG
jgi:hypothetical protein